MGWAVYQSAVEDHVIPEADLREHERSAKCQCMPTATPWHGKNIYVHNSWDGREIRERAEDYAAMGKN